MTYETIAQFARYWFVALILFILYRVIVASVREGKYHRQLQEMRQQGDFPQCLRINGLTNRRWPSWEGATFELYDDNTIGKDKRCDIVVPHQSVKEHHAHIYRQGKQFYIECMDDCDVVVNGGLMESDAQWRLEDGDEVVLGTVSMTVVLENE